MSEQNINEQPVKYRRAKTWQIALGQVNSGAAMCFYILMGYASYCANAGYGIATAAVGIILTCTRIFDGLTDPLIAMLIERTNTRFGKIRLWLLTGWAIESLAVLIMFWWASGTGHGVILFVLLYLLYVIGYTMNNVCGQIIGPIMTNDPKQRPTVSVWSTVYNYLTPMIFSLVITLVILPKYSNQYTVPMLAECSKLCVAVSLVLVLIACVGVSGFDRPENFLGLKSQKKEKVKFKDILKIIKQDKPLQMYIVAASSDKLAQQTASQSIVTTMVYGILIGNMQLSSIVSMIAMLPSILFAVFGAKYAGKHGNKESNVTWTKTCIAISVVALIFYCSINMRDILTVKVFTVIFFLLTLSLNGSKMCVTTATSAMQADIVDYELDRSGMYLPAVVSAAYSFVDKLVSSLGALIATGCVALIGYTTTMPQPTDEYRPEIKFMALFLFYGLPIIGWICTVAAMKFYHLDRQKMVSVQQNIQVKKQAEAVQQ